MAKYYQNNSLNRSHCKRLQHFSFEVICYSSDAGAEPGMVLDVYTVVNIGEAIAGDGVDNYRRETAGEIKIDTIIDKHFARGSIINGNIQQHDIAELHR